MNEPYESLYPEFTRPRANTCPTTTLRRTRPAEFCPDANGCVASLRVPSPPEPFGFNDSKRRKGAFDYETCSPSTSGLPDFIDLDHDLESSLFGDMPSASGASCSFPSGSQGSPGGSGAQKKKRRNLWGPETYAELISKAIESQPNRRATLQQIYKFIIGYNKFFRDRSEGSSSAGWKNSIRHNLSLQAKFIKVGKTMENSKSSYWTIDEKANDKKAYVRRRCVTLDKQTEAAARRKLVHRRELFNQHQKQQQQLHNGETPMEQDNNTAAGAFHRTASNASQGSSSARSEGTAAPSVLTPAPSETVEAGAASAAATAAVATPPASPDGHIEDADDFKKARLELALLVAESCYVNSDYQPGASKAPPAASAKLSVSKPPPYVLGATPSSLPPPLKPPLLFQPQQMLQKFSFDEFLNEQRRKKEQQQPWRPSASPGLFPSHHFRVQPPQVPQQDMQQQQDTQQLRQQQQQQLPQQLPQPQQQLPQQQPPPQQLPQPPPPPPPQQQICQMSPLQLQAQCEQLKKQIRQIQPPQQQQPPALQQLQQLHHLQQLHLLQQIQQQQQQQQQLLQMQLPLQSQQQKTMDQQQRQQLIEHEQQQQQKQQQEDEKQNALLQKIQFLRLQQHDHSGPDFGGESAVPKTSEAENGLDGLNSVLDSALDPILDLCSSWPNSPPNNYSPSPHHGHAPHSSPAPSPFPFAYPQQASSSAAPSCSGFGPAQHIVDGTRSNSLVAIASLPPANAATSPAAEKSACDLRGSRSLDNIPCSMPLQPAAAEGVASHPQYFRFAGLANAAAQFEPHRTC